MTTDSSTPRAAFNGHPSVAIRALNNLISRYLRATQPQEASQATGDNTHIIMFLAKQQGDVFQYDIERQFSITRSTASRVLSLMEKKGLIERQSVERDARLRKIVLKQPALDIVDALTANYDRMEAALLEGITEEQKNALLDCMMTMKQNLIRTGYVGEDSAHNALPTPASESETSETTDDSETSESSATSETSDERNSANSADAANSQVAAKSADSADSTN